jgi:hypothetical protein
LVSNLGDASLAIFGVCILGIALTLTIYAHGTLRFVLQSCQSIPEWQWNPAQLAAKRLLRVASALRWFIFYEILVLALLPRIPGAATSIISSFTFKVLQGAGLWFVLLLATFFVPVPWSLSWSRAQRHRNKIQQGPVTPHHHSHHSHHSSNGQGHAYVRPMTGHGATTPLNATSSHDVGVTPATHAPTMANAAWPSPSTGTLGIAIVGVNGVVTTSVAGQSINGMNVDRFPTRGNSMSGIALAASPRAFPPITTPQGGIPTSQQSPNATLYHNGIGTGAPLSPIQSMHSGGAGTGAPSFA